MSYTRKPYEESEEVKAARNALETHNASKPAYTSSWGGQLNDTLDKILNRGSFNYDINGDALYQQYKDKYIQQGKMAMQDTVGQVSAQTGGYGNSWAATAGNQAYQAHLNNLNDVVPELYALAYDKYNQEGDDMRQKYALLADKEATDYGRYKDQLSAWNTDREDLQGALDDASARDYNRYLTDEEREYETYLDGLTGGELTNDNVSYWTELFYNTAKNGTFNDIAQLMTKAEESGLSPTIVDNIYDNALDMVYFPDKYSGNTTDAGDPPNHQSVNGWYNTIMSTAYDEFDVPADADDLERRINKAKAYIASASNDGISADVLYSWVDELAYKLGIDASRLFD